MGRAGVEYGACSVRAGGYDAKELVQFFGLAFSETKHLTRVWIWARVFIKAIQVLHRFLHVRILLEEIGLKLQL